MNLVEHGGFSAFVVFAHTNAIFSPPAVGGILTEAPEGDFRIDHDQKLNTTTNLQYLFNKPRGLWTALSWRYDSGLVAGAVSSLEDALALTADQQAAIGFFCGSQFASGDVALTAAKCSGSNFGATRLVIPAEGTADDVQNPPRIAPRHLFDIGIGAVVDAVAAGLDGLEQVFRPVHELRVGHTIYRMSKMRSILMSGYVLAASAVVLTACGQKGNLLLPTDPAAANRATLTEALVPDLEIGPAKAPAAATSAPSR